MVYIFITCGKNKTSQPCTWYVGRILQIQLLNFTSNSTNCCITFIHTWAASLCSITQLGPALSRSRYRLPSFPCGGAMLPSTPPRLGVAPGLGLPWFLLSTCFPPAVSINNTYSFPTTITWSLNHLTHVQHYWCMTHYTHTYTNYGFSSYSSSRLLGRSAGPDPSCREQALSPVASLPVMKGLQMPMNTPSLPNRVWHETGGQSEPLSVSFLIGRISIRCTSPMKQRIHKAVALESKLLFHWTM